MTNVFLRPVWRGRAAALLLALAAGTAHAANGCSAFSPYAGNNGKTWLNEYYLGSSQNFLEIFSRNPLVNQSNPKVWNNWRIAVYHKKGRDTYSLGSNTAACTAGGSRTYLTYSSRALKLNHNDAMVVVFDGDPDLSTTREIDAFVHTGSALSSYEDVSHYYLPTCGPLRSALYEQGAAAWGKSTYKGQNILVVDNAGNKDYARTPDGIGNWSQSSGTGSNTSFSRCTTNDPVDLVKAFTWPPAYTSPTSAGTVDPGALVTFTITARNTTLAAMTGVKVSDTLPDGLTLSGSPSASTGATASCAGTPAACTLTAAALAPGATASMSFQARVSDAPAFAGVTIRNSATQTDGAAVKPPPPAEATITVGSGLGLAIGANPASANSGDKVGFTVTARNDSYQPMAGAVVTVPFPTGLAYDSSYAPVASAGTVSCSSASCLWTLPATLAAGTALTMRFQAAAVGSPGQVITVSATQTAGATLSVRPSASATVTMAAAAAAGFNACHNFAASACSIGGARLLTRMAGSPFSTDIVVLKADGTIEKSFVGAAGAARTIRVELVDAGNATAVVATQNITFPAGDVTGRVVANWPALPNAYAYLQVRIIDAGGAQPKASLSSDRFAVRPPAITVSTDASAVPAAINGLPAIKAGAPFTVTAVTRPAAGYTGLLLLDAARLSTANARVGSLEAAGSSAALSVEANAAQAGNASYDEVGYLHAAPGALRDDAFTAIDRDNPPGCDPASTCDCISSTANDAHLSDALVGNTGRYGCSIGNRAAVSFGRFIPDHFAVKSSPVFEPGHAECGFSYMDQPFTLSAVIEARNRFGLITQNYDGAFATGIVDAQVQDAGNGAISASRLQRPGTQAWSRGSYQFLANKFSRLAEPDGPFDRLAIGVSVSDEPALPAPQRPWLRERDVGQAAASCTPDTSGASDGSCTAVNLVPDRTTRVRFGRLRLFTAHGGQPPVQPVPMRAEYFKTGIGWVRNMEDDCTRIDAANVQVKNYMPAGLESAYPARGVRSVGVLNAGAGLLSLVRAGPVAGKGSMAVCIDLGPDTPAATAGFTAPACMAEASAGMPWLQGRWSESRYDDDPTARLSFGIATGGPVIYMREMH